MSAADLPQTRSQLLDLALARGFPEREVGYLHRACELATILIAIIALAADSVDSPAFVTAFTAITFAYLISRGIAKASRVLEQ